MKIAVESTVKLQEHDLKRLGKIGEVKVYQFSSTREEFLDVARDCEVIIGNKKFYNDTLPELKARIIALWSTGYDLVNVKKCKELGITVTNVPAYSTNSVAEAAIALLLELAKRLRYQRDEYNKGNWCYDLEFLTELSGKTIGIIGFGNIGKKVAQIAYALNMKVLVFTRTPKPSEFSNYEFVSLGNLLKKSDFVTLHASLDDATRHLINKDKFEKMKKTAFIINCSRGAVINEKDLIDALKNKTIAGAGLDVFETEPLPIDSDLTKLDNVVMTPHTAFWTNEAVERLNSICIDNIENFLKKEPTNKIV